MDVSEVPIPHAREHWEPALAGDADAALSLAIACHDYQRGELAHTFWTLGAPSASLRVLVEAALIQTHHYSAIPDLYEMLWDCEFPVPAWLPENPLIYHGGHSPRAVSWTLDLGVAQSFVKNRSGRVWSARIPRDAILFYSYDRNEQEVIPDPDYVELLDDES